MEICEEIETLEHVLLRCRKYRLRVQGVTEITMGNKLESGGQKRKCIIVFLKKTGLMD